MARGISSLLTPPSLNSASPARVTIGHVQLRDVLICPHERGLVTYPQNHSIIEHDILAPTSNPRALAELSFTPNSLSALNVPNTDDTLLAAGGQDAELYLSLFSSTPQECSSTGFSRRATRGFGRRQWESKCRIEPGSINNSVLLTSLSLTSSHESSVEPRLFVSNNDRTVKFFDVSLRRVKGDGALPRLSEAGQWRLDVPVNHSSISPDGRTLLCVGDSPDVYLHRITGGSRITVIPICKLSLSPYIAYNPYSFSMSSSSTAIPASFSTAFSADGSKFAVASQEGAVVVWDVRSTKPLKVFQTDKSRTSKTGTGYASGFLYEEPWDWSRGSINAPGWGVRSVKFSPPGAGREIMTFTEHTSLLHVVDARTFEKEEIVRMPDFDYIPSMRQSPVRPRSVSPLLSQTYGTSRPWEDAPPPPPPRIMLFSGALEDTFRIPPSESSRRRSHPSRHPHGGEEYRNADDDVDGIVVIPPLGDRQVENDVRRLLSQHGLRARSAVLDPEQMHDNRMDDTIGREHDEDPAEDEMDVDELEADCFSSHAPSRSASPSPVIPSSGTRTSERGRVSRPTHLLRRESSGPYSTRRATGGVPRRHRRGGQADGGELDQDLAGTCFDPTGTHVYVASVKGVAEWTVRGADQRWWTNTTWA
ncbi:uncharacterized protein LAESUDRAFT_731086 [Laetiporus sulphureus 93-53]|uniref:DUF2415 domain-containing protein n=1 Tax=Laetiporus sulphureus 93-53 TaxID=1314785 RepID=A0A165BRF6_9APHY|nr:uncharacterized protein LAESUDRAFT_731086 [Laetiporus sulphureus 93-53]KZT01516.1 hypothetical protein LAESUDRAFT_731086 [Laetiporus sulphureus 93-53]